ncbi:MAG: NAD-dependent protein deacylase [Candidatus Jordarchaeum sp.]|uniref:NAD-dependent protein deacylase n=1 Tax=Candidatus Jordarchaeum sp. TaxID=2823881 RepID=UPI00404BA1AE
MYSEEEIKKAAKDIVNSKIIIALTGAGISTESGIPDFRGKNGLWTKYDPADFTYSRFLQNPAKYWKMSLELADLLLAVEPMPNPAHLALARLEEVGKLKCIVTQNVDGLHQAAGNTDVIEFHGNLRRVVCIACGEKFPHDLALEKASNGQIPPLCDHCKGVLKPDAVLFEEPIPRHALERSLEEARNCDLMLVVGTSAVVYPAAELPRIAKERGGYRASLFGFYSQPRVLDYSQGAKVIEINAEPTPLTGIVSDYLIEGKAGEILPKIVKEVETQLCL